MGFGKMMKSTRSTIFKHSASVLLYLKEQKCNVTKEINSGCYCYIKSAQHIHTTMQSFFAIIIRLPSLIR